MPITPRPSKKAKKIVYNLIGIPANMVNQERSSFRRKIDKKLDYEESRLSR